MVDLWSGHCWGGVGCPLASGLWVHSCSAIANYRGAHGLILCPCGASALYFLAVPMGFSSFFILFYFFMEHKLAYIHPKVWGFWCLQMQPWLRFPKIHLVVIYVMNFSVVQFLYTHCGCVVLILHWLVCSIIALLSILQV